MVAVVQSLSWVQLFAIPWTAGHQAFLSFAISQNQAQAWESFLVEKRKHIVIRDCDAGKLGEDWIENGPPLCVSEGHIWFPPFAYKPKDD